jgi:hypothetical protein
MQRSNPVTRTAIRWLIGYAITTLSGIALVLLALWGMDGFQGFNLDAGATAAVVVGIAVTSALGVGLMGLVFYSDRINVDEDAYRATAAVNGQNASVDADVTIAAERRE